MVYDGEKQLLDQLAKAGMVGDISQSREGFRMQSHRDCRKCSYLKRVSCSDLIAAAAESQVTKAIILECSKGSWFRKKEVGATRHSSSASKLTNEAMIRL
jgi:predicted GIY-YIG superfamily endonuclease